jgi:hypothetical protein
MLPSRAQRRPKALHLLLAAVLIGSTAALAALVWWPPALPEQARAPQAPPEQAGSAQVWQPCPAAEAPEPAAPVVPPPSAAPPAPAAPPTAPPAGELAGCKRGE